MIEKIIKAIYILTVALVVFLGGLLISKGMHVSLNSPVRTPIPAAQQIIIDSQEGSAL